MDAPSIDVFVSCEAHTTSEFDNMPPLGFPAGPMFVQSAAAARNYFGPRPYKLRIRCTECAKNSNDEEP